QATLSEPPEAPWRASRARATPPTPPPRPHQRRTPQLPAEMQHRLGAISQLY
ncbi:unnamed protein product, partial [Ceratitis capitata]